MRFPRRRLAVALALAVVLPACAKPVDPAQEAEKIRELSQRWNQAIAARDSSALAAFYADDAVLQAPNMAPVTGRRNIESWWGSTIVFPNMSLTFAASQVSVARSGDLAYQRGTYRMSVETPQGPVSDAGKTLLVWKKEKGEWKVAVDMYSSDERLFQPPAAPRR
jgi:uncharacterized protein (TIGR02246 family)